VTGQHVEVSQDPIRADSANLRFLAKYLNTCVSADQLTSRCRTTVSQRERIRNFSAAGRKCLPKSGRLWIQGRQFVEFKSNRPLDGRLRVDPRETMVCLDLIGESITMGERSSCCRIIRGTRENCRAAGSESHKAGATAHSEARKKANIRSC
jgi:hypothetical protein